MMKVITSEAVKMARLALFTLGSILLFLTANSSSGTTACSVRVLAEGNWQCGTTVYWNLGSGFPTTAQSQIRAAFSAYNAITSYTRITFVEVTPGLDDEGYHVSAGTTNGGYGKMANTLSYGPGDYFETSTTVFYLDERQSISDSTKLYNDGSSNSFYAPSYEYIFKKVMLHEIGHTMGINHPALDSSIDPCNEPNGESDGVSVMNHSCGPNDYINNEPSTMQNCDRDNLAINCPTPTPTPTPTLGQAGYCQGVVNYTLYPSTGCTAGLVDHSGYCDKSWSFQSSCYDPSGYQPDWPEGVGCGCPDGVNTTPIIIDVDHSGFSLTDLANGVNFDIVAEGVTRPISWTASGSTNAFLALDRNGNGIIDNGEELFGNVTPQPQSSHPNGYIALAEYDNVSNGGNNDGYITDQDLVFPSLLLWQDTNHNGVSEPNELHTLASLGLQSIDLDYRESKNTDQFGNRFRYRSKVKDSHGAQLGRWAWDVFLLTGN